MKALEALEIIKLNNKATHPTQDWSEVFGIVKQSLNELERLRTFKATFDRYELSKKQGFIAYENWKECEKELKRLQKKEEPMKPIRLNDGDDTCLCPHEHEYRVLNGTDLVCHRCGQVIEWSDEK